MQSCQVEFSGFIGFNLYEIGVYIVTNYAYSESESKTPVPLKVTVIYQNNEGNDENRWDI